jgi:hypothetical protein
MAKWRDVMSSALVPKGVARPIRRVRFKEIHRLHDCGTPLPVSLERFNAPVSRNIHHLQHVGAVFERGGDEPGA